MYYFNARWYDPNLGRFITEDPAKDGSNWHVYCNNNPVNFIDPTGLWSYYNPSGDSGGDDRGVDVKQNYYTGGGGGSGHRRNSPSVHVPTEKEKMKAIADGVTADYVNIETDSFYIDGERGTAGWRDGALQTEAGYFDWYDNHMHRLGFDIDATKLSLPRGVDLRLWKGDYDTVGNLPVGGGGEIGFYKNHRLMSGTQLSEELGLISTKLEIIEKETDRPVAERTEESQSWTTVFKPSDNPGKENIYSKTTYNFNSKENADNFLNNADLATTAAEWYPHNRNQKFTFERDNKNNSISIIWGK